MNDYDAYDDYDADNFQQNINKPITPNEQQHPDVDFDDPSIAALPRILLMGPRRAGKTSIQVLL